MRVGRSFHRLADRGEAFLEEGRPGCGSRTAGNGDERSRANRNAGGSESVPCGLEGVSVDIEAVVEIAGLTPKEGNADPLGRKPPGRGLDALVSVLLLGGERDVTDFETGARVRSGDAEPDHSREFPPLQQNGESARGVRLAHASDSDDNRSVADVGFPRLEGTAGCGPGFAQIREQRFRFGGNRADECYRIQEQMISPGSYRESIRWLSRGNALSQRRAITTCGALVAATLGGCGGAPPAPGLVFPATAPAPVLAPFPAPVVWAVDGGVELDTGVETIVLPRPFMALDVVGRDPTGLLVQCRHCEGMPIGYVADEDVVYDPLPPEVAAWGSLADFALAIREAAANRDLDALRTVMAFDFSSSLVGPQHPDAAFAVWRNEQFASLDRVPSLLAQGLAPLDDGIWAAPLEYVEDLSYRGLRLGFRRSPDGRWEWLFLIRGIAGE